MPFLTDLELRYVGSGTYETTAPLVYRGASDTITVPTRFRTDLASVPRIFWWFLPPTGLYERAATFHDFGCVGLANGTCLLSSRDVDGLFRRQIREDGTGFVKRWVLWWGVRLGALAKPTRRPGWWKDLPLVALITVLVLGVTVVGVLAIHAGVDWVLFLL